MVKENHIELAGRSIEAVLSDLRSVLGPGIRITCEARDEREALAAVDGGADVVLLDNMGAPELARLSPLLRARARERFQTARTVELEASGGVDERTIGAIAKSGVDRISIGALTHSAPALDLSLELEPLS
jgi:nicotinate-nucleotide pyrophosphorylase (carboxylating)